MDSQEWGMSSVSIGNFDGVHLGHQALVERAKGCSGGGPVTAVTFEPHPITILRPGAAPKRLTTPAERRRLLLEAGVAEVLELEPTPDLLNMDAEAFVCFLREQVPFDLVLEGPDFRFARNRSAGIAELTEIGARQGFRVELLDPVHVCLEDQTMPVVRSTLVRWLLEHRRPVDAARALGRPYRLSGTVVSGDKRGRTLGYPTANLDHGALQLPGDGIYAGVGMLPDGTRCPAAISVGSKPTFGGQERLCEVHLLDHDGPLDEYGWTLEVDFHRFLRDQLLCEDIDDLLKRMRCDCDTTRRMILESSVS